MDDADWSTRRILPGIQQKQHHRGQTQQRAENRLYPTIARLDRDSECASRDTHNFL